MGKSLTCLSWEMTEKDVEHGMSLKHDGRDNSIIQGLSFLTPPPTAYVCDHHSPAPVSSINFYQNLSTGPPKAKFSSKTNNSIMRRIRHHIFSVYRRLFALVFLANLAVFLYVLITHRGVVGLPLSTVADAVTANLTLTVLMRQELVINALFIAFGSCPQWVPLYIRRSFGKIYHFGGVHSGCGVSAVLWFSLFTAMTIRGYVKDDPPRFRQQPALLGLTVAIYALLVSIVTFAHPKFRALAHNSFEAVHRFAGWISVALFWAELMVLTSFQHQNQVPRHSFCHMLLQNPSFWMLGLVTVCIVLPWMRLRNVDVRPERLSNHAIRLHFTYTTPTLCEAPRVSDRPLKEWHAFASIPEPNGRGYSILVSRAGDWTQRMIDYPPTKLWVRGFLTRGVLAMAPLFNRTVLVATGSGIGPCLSLLNSSKRVPCRVLWSTQTPTLTYKQNIVADVRRADPHAVIIDTNKIGRPDLEKIAYDLYVQFEAEAVFVISNPRVTRKVVYGLESRGIPAFAPIFDS